MASPTVSKDIRSIGTMFVVRSNKLGIITELDTMDELVDFYLDLKHQYGSGKIAMEYMFLENRMCDKHGQYLHDVRHRILQRVYPSASLFSSLDEHELCGAKRNRGTKI